MQLSAISVSRRIAGLLDHPRKGTALAVFPRSCYLDLDGRIVAVVAAELLNGPLNLVISFPPGGTFVGLSPGDPVALGGRIVEIGRDGGGERWRLDATQAELWDPHLDPIAASPDLQRTIHGIETILTSDAPAESLARAAGRPRRAVDGMAHLAGAMETCDPSIAGLAAETLAGLGPGLTPSGDDVLAGALLALALIDPPGAFAVRERIVGSIHGRTTRISEAYLEAAAGGDAGEAWHQLLGLLRDRARQTDPPEVDLHGAVRRILAFGETSGADMLAGFVLAMTALHRR